MDVTGIQQELTREELEKGHVMRFRAQGGSMSPFIRTGDMVTVEPAEARMLRVGDVVLFQSGRLSVVHRMLYQYVRGGTVYLLTKGDSVPDPDHPVPATRLLGRVKSIERHGRKMDLDSRPARAVAVMIALSSPLSVYWRPVARRLKSALKRTGLLPDRID